MDRMFRYELISETGCIEDVAEGTWLGEAILQILDEHPAFLQVTFWRPSYSPNPIARIYPKSRDEYMNAVVNPDSDMGLNPRTVLSPTLCTYVVRKDYYEDEIKEFWR